MKQKIVSLKKEIKMKWWVKCTTRFVHLQVILNTSLFLASVITGYISMSTFGCLFGIRMEITSFAVEFNICSKTAGIKI